MWRKTWFGSTRSMNVWLASLLLWRSSKVSELRHFSIFYKNNHTMPIVNQTITIGMAKITFISKFKWYQISLNQNKTVNKPFLPFVPEKRKATQSFVSIMCHSSVCTEVKQTQWCFTFCPCCPSWETPEPELDPESPFGPAGPLSPFEPLSPLSPFSPLAPLGPKGPVALNKSPFIHFFILWCWVWAQPSFNIIQTKITKLRVKLMHSNNGQKSSP